MTETAPATAALVEIADAALALHFRAATHEHGAVCGSDAPFYVATQTAVIEAFRLAFPDLDPAAVYLVWIDCMEDAAYCADVVRRAAIEAATMAAHETWEEEGHHGNTWRAVCKCGWKSGRFDATAYDNDADPSDAAFNSAALAGQAHIRAELAR